MWVLFLGIPIRFTSKSPGGMNTTGSSNNKKPSARWFLPRIKQKLIFENWRLPNWLSPLLMVLQIVTGYVEARKELRA